MSRQQLNSFPPADQGGGMRAIRLREMLRTIEREARFTASLTGRLVIPVGQPDMSQELLLIEKDLTGRIHARDVLEVVFVPMTGGVHTRKNNH